MKTIRKYILSIFLLCVVALFVLNVQSNKMETKIISNDVSSILTLEDIDLNDKETHSFLYSILLEGKQIGKYYNSVSSGGVNELQLHIFQVEDISKIEFILKNFVSERYTIFKKNEKNCGDSCVMPRISYSEALQSAISLDNQLWNVNEGYMWIIGERMYSSDKITFIVLIKENQVIVIELNSNSFVNSSLAKKITNKLNLVDLDQLVNESELIK